MTPQPPGQPPLRSLLAALGLSPTAEGFVRDLVWLRDLGGREVTLLHVLQPDSPGPELAHTRLRALGSYLTAQGFTTHRKLAEGPPAREIAKLAGELGVSAVVVGSRSLREGFTGRVALEVFRRSSVPVLLLRTREPAPESRSVDPLGPDAPTHPVPGRILFPTDFSDSAERVHAVVQGLIAQGDRPVDLLHVLPKGSKLRAEAEAKLDRIADRLREAGASEVRTQVVEAATAHGILDNAAVAPLPLVIMGAQGRGFLARTLLGSVSREVASKVEAPLLLVPS